MKKRSGYTLLILVILITTIGIGSAIYYVTSKKYVLKETSDVLKSDQAINCSESGVSVALDCFKDHIQNNNWDLVMSDCSVPNWTDLNYTDENNDTKSVCQYKVTIEPITNEIYIPLLEKDKTELILLNSGVTGISDISISWKSADMSNGNVLELNVVKDVLPNMQLDQIDYSCQFSGIANTTPNADLFIDSYDSSNEICSANLNVSDKTFAQITPRYSDAREVYIKLNGSSSYPLQGYTVKSMGKSGDITREVETVYLYSTEYGFARLINNLIYTKSVQ